jgi:hypothetical protein
MWPIMGGASWWRAPIALADGVDRLVLTQGPTWIFKIVVFGVAFIGLFGAVATVGLLFGSQPTRLVCDRTAGTCTQNGIALVPLAEIAGVELRKYHVTKQGDFYAVALQLGDGSTRDVGGQGAQSPRSIAEYRASVEAMRAFLANPGQARLDTTFTYYASVWERVRMVVLSVMFLPIAVLLIFMTSTTSYTFAGGKIVASTTGPLRSASTEVLPFARVTAIADHLHAGRRQIALVLDDGSRLLLVDAADAPEALVGRLRQLLGKPVQ